MKEKYADQDQEEREMRMKLIGAKDVQGFDINKHQEHKLGELLKKADAEKDEEEAQDETEVPEEFADD